MSAIFPGGAARPAMIRRLLAVTLFCVAAGVADAAPFGTIGGPADTLIRVSSLSGYCAPPGPVCIETTADLPVNDYASDPTAFLIASASVNHAAGLLHGSLVAAPQGNTAFGSVGELSVNARDRFTVDGPNPGELATITSRLKVEGMVIFEGEPSLESAIVEALLSHAPNAWDPVSGGLVVSTGSAKIFRSGLNPAEDIFDITLEAEDTFDVVVGETFQVAYRMDLDGGQSGGIGQRSVEFDFLNSARLSFDLAPGYSISSELGYSSTAVPVPAALVLLGSACVCLVRCRVHKRAVPSFPRAET